MSAAAAATAAPPVEAPKKKGKKLLFILIGVVVLALAGAGGALYVLKKNTSDDGEHAEEETMKPLDAKSAPTFLPLDNMVVNLADAGGNRFVQVGLTLQLSDTATGDAVKAFMPSLRSQILVLISQRTSEELLQVQGKEKLAADIIASISRTMGYGAPKAATGKDKVKDMADSAHPVQAVLFSSFIVQ
jgi:flagellar FliL protein